MKFKIGLLFLFFMCFCNAQKDSLKIKESFIKSQEFYKNQKSYALDIDYSVFKSFQGNEKLENYKSAVSISNKNSYYKIHNTEFVQIDGYSVKINHDEQAVLVKKELNKGGYMDALNNVLMLLPQFKSYTFNENKEGYTCELLAHDVTQLPYRKVLIYFNKDYSLKKQILYLTSSLPYEETEGTVYSSPRLEIQISNIRPYKKDKKLQLKTYLKVINDRIILSEQLSKYQLIK